MVVIELGRSNARLLAFASDFAGRMGIGLMGVAACQPMVAIYDQSMVLGDYVQQDRDELEAEIKIAKAEFYETLDGRGIDLEWHSTITISSLCDYTVARAGAADIILCATGDEAMPVTSRRAGLGDIIMRAGRPVLLVPAPVEKLTLDHVVVAWKETREARREIFDALPLLKRAGKVTVVELVSDDELSASKVRLDEVTGWLRHHQITVIGAPALRIGDDTEQLARFFDKAGADLTVAGAYGHSRMREWALGGVTRDLFLSPVRCALLSH